jgi:hypothetical protein
VDTEQKWWKWKRSGGSGQKHVGERNNTKTENKRTIYAK